jgi:hypothetical protein
MSIFVYYIHDIELKCDNVCNLYVTYLLKVEPMHSLELGYISPNGLSILHSCDTVTMYVI